MKVYHINSQHIKIHSMATKKEKETIASIRNAFTPLYNYFSMREDVRNSDLPPEQKADLYALVDKEDQNAQAHSKRVKELLDSLG